MKTFLDKHGIAFADHRALLPERSADFPKRGIVKDREALEEIGWVFSRCQACGRKGRAFGLHRHHIIGGVGRSHERTNLIVLCSEGPDHGCHAEAHGGNLSLANILWIKWRDDRAEIDWVRLAILRGCHLPEPEKPEQSSPDPVRKRRITFD